MLAFDIETQGLDARRHAVTVVSTEDFATGARRNYEFARVRAEEPAGLPALVDEMVQQFEEATSLCAFNGVRFDLQFLQTALHIDAGTVTRWVLKTTDILECSRLVHGKTFSLNLLCETNGMPVKISSGLEAMRMAEQGRWQQLREYCADDVTILCKLYALRHIKHPRLPLVVDLSGWAHPALYSEQRAGCAGEEASSEVDLGHRANLEAQHVEDGLGVQRGLDERGAALVEHHLPPGLELRVVHGHDDHESHVRDGLLLRAERRERRGEGRRCMQTSATSTALC